MLEEIKQKALNERVPIIKDGGLSYLLKTIEENNYKNILELGTAVGYSSINMARISKDIKIDTVEKNEEMYAQAIVNVKNEGLDKQISIHFTAIEDFKTDKIYDLIFVDAAKAQYGKYMEQFLPNLADDGVFLFDNMIFHGLIYDAENIKSRNTRSLVKKIIKFRESIQNDERFDIIFYDDIGDGVLVARKKEKVWRMKNLPY